tara:strand:+ start:645 stop:977 length:333 start_codon:yes stop_codon:yes gene_type:complete
MIHEFNYTYEFVRLNSDMVHGIKVITEVVVNITAVRTDDESVSATKEDWVTFSPYSRVKRLDDEMLHIDSVTNDIALEWAVAIFAEKESDLNIIFTAMIYGIDYVHPPEE